MGLTRKLCAGLLALALAPGTCVRSELPVPDYHSPVFIEPLLTEEVRSGPLKLDGAWALTSENDRFGGYSALIAYDHNTLLAASDAGRLMHLPRPDRDAKVPRLGQFANFRRADKSHADIESLAFDPDTRKLWAGLEWAQQIIRFGPRFNQQAQVRPAAMRDWGSNSGPEAMVRLRDGRFVVIEERAAEQGQHEALLFAGDPTDGDAPLKFRFAARKGFRPADAAQLPNGKIVVLLRGFRFGLPPRFPALLVTADPANIMEDELLHSRLLARIEEPFPSDNYEGLTVVDERDGSWSLWLISDDNFASYQRTLLLKLRWDLRQGTHARQRARGYPRAP